MKESKKRLLLSFSGGALVLVVCALVAYYFAPRILCVDSGDCRGGAIVVLGGDPLRRPIRAAELFHERAASIIIASGDGDCSEAIATLKQHGVPATAIWREDRSGSTKANADYSIALLRKAKIKNVIIVTSWYHSRRALVTFRKLAPEIRFYSRPCYYNLSRSEWSRTGVSAHIRLEYIKLIAYWICYGISPI